MFVIIDVHKLFCAEYTTDVYDETPQSISSLEF
jgi:hypothetical protein